MPGELEKTHFVKLDQEFMFLFSHFVGCNKSKITP
jgi:hypothetical protein